jgi:hypothetical protein
MSARYTETALSAAFLKALTKWAAGHSSTDKITLPTGILTAAELVPVLRTLGFRGESPPPTAHDRLNGGRSKSQHTEIYHG